MSLVERALDKLRTNQPTASRGHAASTSASQTVGTLVDSDPFDSAQAKFLVRIDREALRAAGYLPEADQDRRFADEYRQIKRPILAAAFASDASARRVSPRLLMMASALPGDGKTFTSINLALSLARERDSSVVLVDADVAKPHISRIFGVQSQRGLLDALSDQSVDVTSLVLPTDVRGLAILPAGNMRESASELLASGRMSELTTQLLQQHPRSVVLFDSPPLIVSSESRAIASRVGQVVLVVRAGQTPKDAVREAAEALDEDCIVSLVLNQGRRNITNGLYGYGYGTYGQDENP